MQYIQLTCGWKDTERRKNYMGMKEAVRKIGPFVHTTKHVTKIAKLLSFIGLYTFFNGLLVTTVLHVIRL